MMTKRDDKKMLELNYYSPETSLCSDEKTIQLYRAREKSLHERANMISSAKEEGIEEGIEQGIEKGKGEIQTNIALNLLDILDDKTISMKTGLNIEDIKNLRKYKQ